MVIWLASYPRSGNTFLRIALHRLYGVATYSVYEDNDPVAQRVGVDLVGYRARPADRATMATDPRVFFMKTHKRRKADGYPAIYLVRDGRDAVVSAARLRVAMDAAASDEPGKFERFLREEITRPFLEGQPSSGSWGGNVLSWLNGESAGTVVLKYEDLVADPRGALTQALSSLVPNLEPLLRSQVPCFGELHALDPGFFRRGVVGSHRDEMPSHLQELFWAQPENAAAMMQLGYSAPSTGS